MIDISHTRAHNLSVAPGLTHAFLGRQGGHSAGLYDSLNLGTGSDDIPAHVEANRDTVKNAFQANAIQSCHQVHSADVVTLTEPLTERPRGDAMVTAAPGLALCILTADCVPVLFADPVAGIVGAAHAGWKGAMAGICEETITALEALGAYRSRICAAIGPAIQQASYEVGPEFRDTWLAEHDWTDRLFKPGKDDRFHFDLTGYVQKVLLSEALSSVDNLGHDTCAMENTYFSNRRRNHLGEPDYGRNGSVIMINADR